MTNTFLEDLKELGYTQAEAIDALKGIKTEDPVPTDPVPEAVIEEQHEQIDAQPPSEAAQGLSVEEKAAIISSIKIDNTAAIEAEVKKQLKVIRGTPPVGVEEDKPVQRLTLPKLEFEKRI